MARPAYVHDAVLGLDFREDPRRLGPWSPWSCAGIRNTTGHTHLFTEVLDGRNAHLTDRVERALGRAPGGFTGYARAAWRRQS